MSMVADHQQTVKPLRRCKACQACRERKVKCDGKRPACGYCQQQSKSCQYSGDKRQTSRVSKDVISTMNYKVMNLEEMVKRLEQSLQNQSQGQTPHPGSILSSPACTASHQIQAHSTPPIAPFGPSPGSNTNLIRYAESPSPSFEDFGGHRSVDTVQSTSPLAVQPFQQGHGTASPQEDTANSIVLGFHTRVSNAVHGPTSAFHPQSFSPASQKKSDSSESPAQSLGGSQSFGKASNSENNVGDLRARLFMFSASEKQNEHIYEARRLYDFDGVDYETAMHLLELHWNHQHNAYLWSYRPAILNSLTNNGPYASKLLLNAIFFASALNSDRESLREDKDDPQTKGNRFLARFNELLLPELDASSIPNAVALLQMASSLVANGRQTSGWLYSGLGYRMMVDLGLHVDPDKIRNPGGLTSTIDTSMSFIDVELQRRVFWGAYVNDRFQSLYFGRPPTLPATGAEPPQTLLDTYEEMDLWAPYVDPENPSPLLSKYSPKPMYAISTFGWLVKLAQISSDITEYLYMPATCNMNRSTALEHFNRLRHRLDMWQKGLPQHLQYEPEKDPPPPTHQFNLHTTYNTLNILLHRPFLPEGHLKHFDLDEHSARQTCVAAALRIYYLAKAYRDTFTLRRAPYLFSYSLFSAATVIPNNDIPGWSDLQKNNLILFFWNALLELQKGSNFGLRRPIKIIRDFLERAGIDVNALATRPDSGSALKNPNASMALARAGVFQGDAHSSMTAFHGADSNIDYSLMYPDMFTDNLDWLNCSINPAYDENDDMLYGLFRDS